MLVIDLSAMYQAVVYCCTVLWRLELITLQYCTVVVILYVHIIALSCLASVLQISRRCKFDHVCMTSEIGIISIQLHMLLLTLLTLDYSILVGTIVLFSVLFIVHSEKNQPFMSYTVLQSTYCSIIRSFNPNPLYREST